MPLAGQTIKPLVKLGRAPQDCWEWLGPRTDAGHGKKTFHGKEIMATHWLWSQLFGPVPAGYVIFAACGNKGCMNPHHLRCGHQADANRMGPHVKLLPDDVREIRSIDAGERSPAMAHTLAQRFGVQVGHVREIWRGAVWGRKKKNHGPRKVA